MNPHQITKQAVLSPAQVPNESRSIETFALFTPDGENVLDKVLSTPSAVQIISGDVTIATIEATIPGYYPEGMDFLIGYPSLSAVDQNVVSGPHPGGTVTGGSGAGIYRFDGTNLNFMGAPILNKFYFPAPVVFDESWSNVGAMGSAGALQSIDFDGPGEGEPMLVFVSLGVPSDVVSYSPAETTDWTGDDPTTMKQAIDRIAAALGPIA